MKQHKDEQIMRKMGEVVQSNKRLIMYQINFKHKTTALRRLLKRSHFSCLESALMSMNIMDRVIIITDKEDNS